MRRPVGYRPIVPPPPLPPRRRGGCTRLALLCVAMLVLTGAAFTVLSGRATGWSFGPFGVHSSYVPTSTPARLSATTTPVCLPHVVDTSAASRVSHVQMTTALRDAAKQDYRPRNNTTSFHAGQQAFITFELTSAAGGTVGVTFCTPHGNTVGTLHVPAGSAGRYGEFSIALDAADVGKCVATLTWDETIAAEVRFTVTS